METNVPDAIVQTLGADKVTHSTAQAAVEELGVASIVALLTMVRNGGASADRGRTGLGNVMLCVSDGLGRALEGLNLKPTKRAILRACKLDGALADRLRRLRRDRQTHDDEIAIVAAFACGDGKAISEPRSVAPQPGPADPEPSPGDNGPGLHIYGATGAVCFEPLHSGEGNLGLWVAAALRATGRRYHWADKIIMKLSEQEVLFLYAALRGFVDVVAAKEQFSGNDKAFSVENRGTHFFMKVHRRGRGSVALPIRSADAVRLAMLVGEAIVRAKPHLVDMSGADRLVAHMRGFVQSGQLGAA